MSKSIRSVVRGGKGKLRDGKRTSGKVSRQDAATEEAIRLHEAAAREAGAPDEAGAAASRAGEVARDSAGGLSAGTIALGVLGVGAVVGLASGGGSSSGSGGGSPPTPVDTTPPLAPTGLALAALDDTGASSSDRVTSQVSGLTISGQAEAGARVELFDGLKSLGTATANGAGAFSLDVDLAAGATHAITAKATDAAGNTSVASAELAITVDKAAPTIELQSASVRNQTITLSYDSPLDAANPPPATAFAVTTAGVANPVASVAVSGNTVILTLANAFQPGAVSVTYTDPADDAGSAIQDIAGNDAATFSSGFVADGYIRDARVYIDVNGNGEVDQGDFFVGLTNANGNFFLPANAPAGTIIAIGGINIDTGVANTLPLKAPAGSTTINPLTTLVQAVIDASPGTPVASASSAVATALGLDPAQDLTKFDPLSSNDAAAVAAQKAAAQVASVATLAERDAGAGDTVVANLASQIVSATASGGRVDLADADTLNAALSGTAVSAEAAGDIATVASEIAAATTQDSISVVQAKALDRVAPAAPTAIALQAASDSGVAGDGLTNAAAPVVRVAFDARATDGSAVVAGDTLALRAGAREVAAIVLTEADVASGHVDIATGLLGDGLHVLTAQLTDKAGNLGSLSASQAITIDTAAPLAPQIVAVAGDDVVNAAEAGAAITGTAEAGATVSLRLGDAVRTASADSTGKWSYTLQAADIAAMQQGAETITVRATDAAGNTGPAAERSIAIDTQASTVTATIAEVIDNVEPGTGPVAAGATTNDNTLVLKGTLSAALDQGDRLAVFDGTTQLGFAEVSGTAWSFAAPGLDNGNRSFTARVVDVAGNSGTASGAYALTINATVPTATVAITTVSDDQLPAAGTIAAGAASDDASPLIAGSIAGTLAAGDVVRVYDRGVLLGNAVISGSTWSYQAAGLAQGSHTLTAVVENAGGNQGAFSAPFAFTVDTTAPLRPEIRIVAADDVIGQAEQGSVISGVAEANATISLALGAELRSATADAAGNWSYTLQAADIAVMGQGAETITVAATDAAGNRSAEATRSIIVDTQAPSSPAIAAIAGSDVINIDAVAGGAVITGTAEAGATVALSLGGSVRMLVADASGNWSYALQSSDIVAMGQGAETISARATDAAGNTGAAAARDIAIDTRAPGVPILTATAGDNVINAAEQAATIAGTAEAGARIDIRLAGDTRTVTADAGGNWTYALKPADIAAMGQGAETITVTATDAAGNAGIAATRIVTVDTVAPTAAVELSRTVLAVGETATVTVRFSEAVADFSNADLVAENGAVGALSSSDGGRTWTGTYTPAANVEDTTNVVRLGTAYADLAGNPGAAATSGNFAIDTLPNRAAIVDASQAVTVVEDGSATLTVSATDPDGDGLTYTAGPALHGKVSGGAGGVFTYVPAADYFGEDAFTVTVDDGLGGTAQQVVRITVSGIEDEATGTLGVTGTAAEGGALVAALAARDVDGEFTVAYRWEKQAGNDWIAIGGANAATLAIPADQSLVGATVRVVATTTDAQNGTTVFTGTGQMIANVQDVATGTLGVTGTAAEGGALAAVLSATDGDGPITTAYRWEQLVDGKWVEIAGATSTNLPIPADQSYVGTQVRVVATTTDPLGGTTVFTSAGQVIANVDDGATGTLDVTGNAAEGDALTAALTGVSDADGATVTAYQWQKLEDGRWVAIAGATSASLPIPADQSYVGMQVRVMATTTDPFGGTTVFTGAGQTIANVQDVTTGTLGVTGTAAEGGALTAALVATDADGAITTTYRWEQLVGGKWEAIAGATAADLPIPADQSLVGATVRAVATTTDPFGDTTVFVSETRTIANVDDAATGAVGVTGQSSEGGTLTAALGVTDPDGTITAAYQWERLVNGQWVAIAGATSPSLTVPADQSYVGAQVRVVATVTDPFGQVTVFRSSGQQIQNVDDLATGTVSMVAGTPVPAAELDGGAYPAFSLPYTDGPAYAGVEQLSDGGRLASWAVDADGNGTPDAIAVQRHDAAGNRVGETVLLANLPGQLFDAYVKDDSSKLNVAVAALANGGYAVSYELAQPSVWGVAALIGSQAPTMLGKATLAIAAKPAFYRIEAITNADPSQVTYALAGTDASGAAITLAVTPDASGTIRVTQQMLDAFAFDDKITLQVSGLTRLVETSVAQLRVSYAGYEMYVYPAGQPVSEVPISVTVSATGTASLSSLTGRVESFDVSGIVAADGKTPSFSFVFVAPGATEFAMATGLAIGQGIPIDGLIAIWRGGGIFTVISGSRLLAPDADGVIAVPAGLLDLIGDSQAYTGLSVSNLAANSTLSGTMIVREPVTLDSGLFTQVYDAAGQPVSGAQRIDTAYPVIAETDSDEAPYLDVQGLPDGGSVISWLVDIDGDGATETLALQRLAADGTRVGATVLGQLPAAMAQAIAAERPFNASVDLLESGGYAVSYQVSQADVSGTQVLSGTMLSGNDSGVATLFIGAVPASFRIVGYNNVSPSALGFALAATGPSGEKVTIAVTPDETGLITVTQGMLDQFAADQRIVLEVAGLPYAPAGTSGSITVAYAGKEILSYPDSQPLTTVADTFAAAADGRVSINLRNHGRVEAFDLGDYMAAAGMTPEFRLIVHVSASAEAQIAGRLGLSYQPMTPVTIGGLSYLWVPGQRVFVIGTGQQATAPAPDENGVIRVPQLMLDVLGTHDAVVTLQIGNLAPDSPVPVEMSVRTPLVVDAPEGLYTQVFDADGMPAGEAHRVDSEDILAGAPQFADGITPYVGVVSVPGGGHAVSWMIDDNGDGNVDAVAIQRVKADGSLDGGTVVLGNLPDSFLDILDNENEFAGTIIAQADGGYAIGYAVQPSQSFRMTTVTAAADGITGVGGIGRPVSYSSLQAGYSYALVGVDAAGKEVLVPVEPVAGTITVTQAQLDRFANDGRIALRISGMQPGATMMVNSLSEDIWTYAPDASVTLFHQTMIVGQQPGLPAGFAALTAPLGRVESFTLDPYVTAPGKTAQFFLSVSPLSDAARELVVQWMGTTQAYLPVIRDGISYMLMPGLNSLTIGLPNTGGNLVPDGQGRIAVPAALLEQLGGYDANVVLLANNLLPGSSLNATIAMRTPSEVADGLFIQNYDAHGVPLLQAGGAIAEGGYAIAAASLQDADGQIVAQAFQWQASSDGTEWFDIPGATGTRFAIPDDQDVVGMHLRVAVTSTDVTGASTTLTSTPTIIANVNDAPQISGITVPASVNDGATATITVQMSDIDGDTLAVSAVSSQGAKIVDQGNGVLAYTAPLDRSTTDYVTITVTDGNGGKAVTSAYVNIVSVDNEASGTLEITGTAAEGGQLVAALSNVSDPDGAIVSTSYQWQRQALGVWTSISGATGTTLAIPDDQSLVGSVVRVLVTTIDEKARSTTFTSASRSIGNVDDPVTGTLAVNGTGVEGGTLTATFTGLVDPDGPTTVSYQWQKQVEGQWADIADATAATLAIPSGQSLVGLAVRVVATVTDPYSGQAQFIANGSIITDIDNPAIGTLTVADTAQEGGTLTASVSVTDVDGATVTAFQWQKLAGTEWVAISGGNAATLSIPADQSLVGATIRATATTTDLLGGRTVFTGASQTVANVDDPATGTLAVTGTAAEGGSLTASLTGISDADGATTTSYQWERQVGTNWVAISGATGATLAIPADQSLVGASIHVVATTTDVLGGISRFTSAPSTVANVNDAPVLAATQSVAATEDLAKTVTVSATDDDGDALTWSVTTAASHGAVSGGTAGAFTYTPAANYAGSDSFTVTVVDNRGGSVTQVVNVSVSAVNDAPVVAAGIADQGVAIGSAWSFTVPAGAFSDVENDTLIWSATRSDGSSLPAWLSFNADTRQFSGTVPAGFDGALSVTVTASDGQASASDTFAIRLPSFAISGSHALNEGKALTLDIAADAVADGTVIPYTLSGAGITASDISGGLSGSVTVNGGHATLSIEALLDRLTEGAEQVNVTLGGIAQGVPGWTIDIADIGLTPVVMANGGTYGANAGKVDTFVLDASKSIEMTIDGFAPGDVLETQNLSADFGLAGNVINDIGGDGTAILLLGNATVILTGLANDAFGGEDSFKAIFGANAISYLA